MGDSWRPFAVFGSGVECKLIVVVIPEMNAIVVRGVHGAHGKDLTDQHIDPLPIVFGHSAVVLPILHAIKRLRLDVVWIGLEDLAISLGIVLVLGGLVPLIFVVEGRDRI